MSMFEALTRVRKRKRGETKRSPGLSEDPQRRNSQVHAALMGAFIKGASDEERIQMGRQLFLSTVGGNVNAREAIRMHLYNTDPDFRDQMKQRLLDDDAAETALKRAKAGLGPHDNRDWDGMPDEDEESFTVFAKRLAWEEIRHGRGGGILAGLGPAIEAAVGPDGVVSKLLTLTMLQQGLLPPANAIPAIQAPDPTQGATPVNTPAAVPLLAGVLTPEDVARILALQDKDVAAAAQETLRLLATKSAGRTDAERRELEAYLDMFINAPFWQVTAILAVGYAPYPEWQPVVRYIEQHEGKFRALQAALEAAVQPEVTQTSEAEDVEAL